MVFMKEVEFRNAEKEEVREMNTKAILKKGVLLFLDKLALTSFSAGVAAYFADHGTGVTELGALKTAAYAAATTAVVYLANAANAYLKKNGQ
jgi:hypothetical protein